MTEEERIQLVVARAQALNEALWDAPDSLEVALELPTQWRTHGGSRFQAGRYQIKVTNRKELV